MNEGVGHHGQDGEVGGMGKVDEAGYAAHDIYTKLSYKLLQLRNVTKANSLPAKRIVAVEAATTDAIPAPIKPNSGIKMKAQTNETIQAIPFNKGCALNIRAAVSPTPKKLPKIPKHPAKTTSINNV
jgi:hypothetical protein